MTGLTLHQNSLVAGLAVLMKAEWDCMVDVALSLDQESQELLLDDLTVKLKVGRDSFQRKMNAVRYVAALGHGAEEIKEFGQEKTLSQFIKSRRQANYTDTVIMKWSVAGSQRELVQQQEVRIKGLLGIHTSSDFWDWMLAQMRNATDAEIRQSAGDYGAEG
jgi:hypothetical protein